ncbi:MAG TPA: c-type cytochrome [Burkholderiales bacterium]|nr:c-type cytochrome [Burkholderiales bacterium]
MSRWIEIAACALLAASGAAAAQDRYAGIGRAATPAEIKAWDIDVRPDFKGLPPGSGSVSKGQDVWDAKCASCHGTFGESNEVFTPVVGGTTQDDIKSGRVKALLDADQQRTTLMKVPTLSTLWDYIHRAMPWNAPKSLTTDEVYAVTAYILNLGGIVGDDFVLSDGNIKEVQARMPNRNGMTRTHGLWDVGGKPDVSNTACMKNCAAAVKVTSSLPDHAVGAHGDLAAQMRTYGPVRGQHIVTVAAVPAATPQSSPQVSTQGKELVSRSGCLACHGVSNKIVGPGFNEIAGKYRGQDGMLNRLVEKVKKGGSGAWGAVPMPPQPQLKDEDVALMVRWIANGAN